MVLFLKRLWSFSTGGLKIDWKMLCPRDADGEMQVIVVINHQGTEMCVARTKSEYVASSLAMMQTQE